jgi:hypothetical protein
MPNFNDAQITGLYVSESGSSAVENNAPNAPAGGSFNLTLEMVAGTGIQSESYTVVVSCTDVTATTAVPAASPLIPGAPINGAGNFGEGAGWTANGPEWWVFNQSLPVGPEPAADTGHVYQYTAALYSKNGQAVSLMQSELFILV